MKNRNWLNIITSLVAVMFILSMYLGLAAAQMPAEKYVNTEKKFEDAKQSFEKANKELRNSKNPKSQDELKQRTRTYIDGAIDTMVARLEVLKYRLDLPENKGLFQFDASKNVDADIARLEQIRTELQKANTPQEMGNAHKELKGTWNNISLETRYYFEIMLNHRIDNIIAKAADNVTTRLDKAIENRKSQNKDVTGLQDDETKFKSQIADAQGVQQQISSLLAAHSGFASDGTVTDNKAAGDFVRQVDKLQRDSIQKLKASSRQLINFVRDFRKLSGGKIGVDRSGELEAGNNTETTATATQTVAATATATATSTATANVTVTETATPIATANVTVTETATPTATVTSAPTANATVTETATETPTPTVT
ncbi:Uncharacterised protein [uncultured archaeon]|nr:Uncharacterised protein [uncultured archaeon]